MEVMEDRMVILAGWNSQLSDERVRHGMKPTIQTLEYRGFLLF